MWHGTENSRSVAGSSRGSSGRVMMGREPRNTKSMRPNSAAIFFMTYFHRVGGHGPLAPPPSNPLLGSIPTEGKLFAHIVNFVYYGKTRKDVRLNKLPLCPPHLNSFYAPYSSVADPGGEGPHSFHVSRPPHLVARSATAADDDSKCCILGQQTLVGLHARSF